jgi:hypothetical protein
MDEIQRFKAAKDTVKTLSDRKIRVEERFKSEKERLEKLLAEIASKGYDPKKLSEIRTELQAKFQAMVEDLEKKAAEVKSKLDAIEV